MIWSASEAGIEIQLPITTPTGKTRVKRPVEGLLAVPVPCRSRPMANGDYLEWQISYDTPDESEPSIVREVSLEKTQGLRYGCELVRLIIECRRLGYFSEVDWRALRQLLDQQLANDGIEETEHILSLESARDSLPAKHGFRRFLLQVPVLVKRGAHYAVEVKIGAKQRAVGLQAMIFVHLPLVACTSYQGNLVGRIAAPNELASFRITPANAQLVHDTILAFVLASRSHARDIHRILSALGL